MCIQFVLVLIISCKMSTTNELCETIFEDVSFDTNFLKTMRSLYQSKNIFHDVILKTEDGGTIEANKLVLASSSSYFKSLLNNTPDKEIKLYKLTTKILTIIVEYCYTGKAVLNAENIQDLLLASDYCGVIPLKNGCVNYLVQNLDVSNCIDLLTLGDIVSSEYLVSIAVTCITHNFLEIFKNFQNRLLSLPSHLMSSILASDDIVVYNESNLIFAAVEREQFLAHYLLKYIDHNKKESTSDIEQLLLSLKLYLLFEDNSLLKKLVQKLHSKKDVSEKFQNIIAAVQNIKNENDICDEISKIEDAPSHWTTLRKNSLENFCSITYTETINPIPPGHLDNCPKFNFHQSSIDFTLSGLVIWMDDADKREDAKILTGLQIQWSDGREETFGNKNSPHKFEITLERGEHINNIKINRGFFVHRMTFYTSFNRVFGPYGESSESEYRCFDKKSCEKNRTLWGLSGTSAEGYI